MHWMRTDGQMEHTPSLGNPCVYVPMFLPCKGWGYCIDPTISEAFLFVARDRDVASELVFVVVLP